MNAETQHTIVSVNIALIDMGERLRSVDPAFLEPLAASIAERGLDSPIHVSNEGGHYRLIAGAHRVEAFRILGRDRIPAFVVDLDADQAALLEVDENLMRRDLSPLDRAVFLAKRKEIFQRLNPASRRGGSRSQSKKTNLSFCSATFSAETGKRIGMSPRNIDRAIRRAESIPAEVRQRLAKLKKPLNGSALDAFAAARVTDQNRLLECLDRGRSFAQAMDDCGLRPKIVPAPGYLAHKQAHQFRRLPAEAQDIFLAELGLSRKPTKGLRGAAS